MSDDATTPDPDGDPENLASKANADQGAATHGTDQVAETAPVQEDPEGRDDPDADPEMLRSTT